MTEKSFLEKIASSSTPREFEKQIKELKKNFGDCVSASDVSPLYELCGIEQGDYPEGLQKIDILDEKLLAYLSDLSISSLIDMARLSFVNPEDSFELTKITIEEIIRRGDVPGQKAILSVFDDALRSYDAGHRADACTIHDILIEDLFIKFEPSLVVGLLESTADDYLHGDEMDGLFYVLDYISPEDEGLQERLLSRYFSYKLSSILYYGNEYFTVLEKSILRSVSKDVRSIFVRLEKKYDTLLPATQFMQAPNPDDLPKYIELLSSVSQGVVQEGYDQLVEIICEHSFSNEIIEIFSQVIYKNRRKKDSEHEIYSIARMMFANGYSPENIFSFFKDMLKADVACNQIVLKEWLRLEDRGETKYFIHDIADTIARLEGIGKASLQSLQVNMYLSDIGYAKKDALDRKIFLLSKLYENVEGVLDIPGFNFEHHISTLLIEGCYYDEVEALFVIMNSKTPQVVAENVLRLIVYLSAFKMKKSLFDLAIKHVPDTIKNLGVSANMACYYALTKEKESMLKYLEISIGLGKTRSSILEDADFEYYLDDIGFKAVLKKAS
ncbi:MAG TPA: hypothetical protein ENJ08_10125 [Gammaproteobacteria bacterium]|nr:hypothetical protein [Gammaproteobacteria bacterium]